MVDFSGTDPIRGLSGAEHIRRIAVYGYNEVPEIKPNSIISFAKKFSGPTAWMLEAVIILSVVLSNYADVYIIAALLVLNAILGFLQEQKASRAVDALKRKLQVNSRTLRDGIWGVIPARDLVPGDIVRVRAGDFVPADLTLTEGNLEVDQSALTGESLTIRKGQADELFSGSIIKSGEATGFVTRTGTRTYYGKTTELVQVARHRLRSEEVVSQVVKWMVTMVGVAVAAALAVSAIFGSRLLDVLPLALVLLASSVPVALPAMFTITMAVGSMELTRRGVLVTRINASEDAATMDVLCLDKTGTITENRLSITGIIAEPGVDADEVILYGALASEAANNDPIDCAFLAMAKSRGLSTTTFSRRAFSPFDPATRRTEAIVMKDEITYRVAKGAISSIAELSGTDPSPLRNQSVEFALKGNRTLAIAAGKPGEALQVMGIVALSDPPRPDAPHLIGSLQDLGISVKILTGDALAIARETARQVGLPGDIIVSDELDILQKTDPEQAAHKIEESAGFARIYPEDKYAIVKSLQESGHTVGMTGDGINDAPALRQAEVGIAVHGATDVAKGAASAVLTGDGLGNIVDLVLVGRKLHQRMLTWIFNKIVKTFQIVVFVVIAFLLTGRFIVSVFGVILLLFVIDFVTLSLSTDNVRGSEKPDSWDISGMVRSSVVLGFLVVLESLIILSVGLGPLGLTQAGQLQTFSFAILFYFGILTVFVVRERGHFWASLPGKPLLLISLGDILVVTMLNLVGIPGLAPIPPIAVLVVAGMAVFFSFVVNDNIKYVMLKKN